MVRNKEACRHARTPTYYLPNRMTMKKVMSTALNEEAPLAPDPLLIFVLGEHHTASPAPLLLLTLVHAHLAQAKAQSAALSLTATNSTISPWAMRCDSSSPVLPQALQLS
jgi:hypothetical protein